MSRGLSVPERAVRVGPWSGGADSPHQLFLSSG